MTLGNAGVFYMVIVLLCSRQRVADTFEKLSAIYKTCESKIRMFLIIFQILEGSDFYSEGGVGPAFHC